MSEPIRPTAPKDRQTWESDIAVYWWDDGILVSLSKDTLRTVELIKRNVSLVKEITGGKPAPLLIYLSNSPVPDRATRAFSSEMVPVIYSAMAMVSRPGLASLVMKMVFALKRAPIPMKTFTNADEAKGWLKSL